MIDGAQGLGDGRRDRRTPRVSRVPTMKARETRFSRPRVARKLGKCVRVRAHRVRVRGAFAASRGAGPGRFFFVRVHVGHGVRAGEEREHEGHEKNAEGV